MNSNVRSKDELSLRKCFETVGKLLSKQARRLRPSDRSPWYPFDETSYTSIAKGKWDHHINGYLADLQMLRPDRLRDQELCDDLSAMDPKSPPLTLEEIQNGRQFFDRVAAWGNYYVKYIEDHIYKNNPDDIHKLMHGANILELGAGDGQVATKYYQRAVEAGVRPKAFYINDIDRSATKKNARVLRDAGVAEENIIEVPGDMVSDKFWKNKVLKELACDKSPTLVIVHGAFLNDLDETQLEKLFNNFRMYLKPQSSLLLAIDHTLDAKTLKRAYSYPRVKQWLKMTFVVALWSMGFKTKSKDIGCYMLWKHREKECIITPTIWIKKKQKVHVNDNKNLKKFEGLISELRLDVMHLPCNAIRKISRSITEEAFKKAKLEVVQCLTWDGIRARDMGKFKKADYVLWHVRTPGRRPHL